MRRPCRPHSVAERDGITRHRRGTSRALRIRSRDFRGMEFGQAERHIAGSRSDLHVSGGRDRRRSGDLPLFRRTLCRLSYPTKLGEPPAVPTGFEPAASGLTGRRALQTAPRDQDCAVLLHPPRDSNPCRHLERVWTLSCKRLRRTFLVWAANFTRPYERGDRRLGVGAERGQPGPAMACRPRTLGHCPAGPTFAHDASCTRQRAPASEPSQRHPLRPASEGMRLRRAATPWSHGCSPPWS